MNLGLDLKYCFNIRVDIKMISLHQFSPIFDAKCESRHKIILLCSGLLNIGSSMSPRWAQQGQNGPKKLKLSNIIYFESIFGLFWGFGPHNVFDFSIVSASQITYYLFPVVETIQVCNKSFQNLFNTIPIPACCNYPITLVINGVSISILMPCQK